jgi:hypothetical protein
MTKGSFQRHFANRAALLEAARRLWGSGTPGTDPAGVAEGRTGAAAAPACPRR